MKKEDKQQLGVFEKFRVVRADREDRPGYKHDGCRLFVLDATHDPHAVPALRAYAASARADGYEPLARDLERWAQELELFLAGSMRPDPGNPGADWNGNVPRTPPKGPLDA